MSLVELLSAKSEALKVRDIAPILGISIQQVYKMAANGQIPSFRVASSIRFDPEIFAAWLKEKYPAIPQRATSRMTRNA